MSVPRETGTPVILCLSPASPFNDLFHSPPWDGYWSHAVHAPAQAPLPGGVPVVRPTACTPLPAVDGPAAVLWLREIEQLQAALKSGARWRAIVFEPSETACLDALRHVRKTLAVVRDLPRGHALAAEDLHSVTDRNGVDATLMPAVVGRRLSYALAAGADLTFGVIL